MGDSRGIELAATQQGEPPPGPLSPGEKAGEYEIVKLLGSGAMGEVYAGTHPVIGKKVAIKVIKQVLAKSEESAQRFIREAKAVNQIDHPNVIDVFAFGRLDDGRLYLVMDLLEGESLADHLAVRGALPLSEVVEIMRPMCAAVAAAHEAGIVHRDLKPANVFLTEPTTDRQKVWILDFGVAKLMSSAQEETGQTLTGEGVWIGTPVYMAPEQWTSDGASVQSDIYALGVIGYELLSGKSPFVADSIPGVMEKHFHAEIPSLKETAQSLPRHVDAAFQQAMAKDPADRFASATDFLLALQGKLKAKPAAKSSAASRHLAPAAMGAAIVLAAGGALYVLKSKKDEKPPEVAANIQPEPPAATGEVRIDSKPTGATVFRDGQPVGSTPTGVSGEAGEKLTITLKKPGYSPKSVDCQVGDTPMEVELAEVTGFVGRWQIPGGELREFKREGQRVHAYKPADGGEWSYYRQFGFVNSEHGVVFQATAEHIDEKLPNEPTCRIPLAAQYRYDPVKQTLTTRRETIDYAYSAGKCIDKKRAWTDYQPVTKLAVAPTSERMSVSSRAGAGPTKGNGGNVTPAQFEGANPPINPAPKKPIRKKRNNKKLSKQQLLNKKKLDLQNQARRKNAPTTKDAQPGNVVGPINKKKKAPPKQQTKAPQKRKKAPAVQKQAPSPQGADQGQELKD